MDAFAGAIGVSDSDGKMSPVVHIYTTPNDNPEFIVHALRVASHVGFIRALAKGIRERSTSFDRPVLKSMLLPRPPREDQDLIVAYLDRETQKIDELINEQRALIETLAERRDAVVSQLLESCGGDLLKLSWLFSFHNGDRGKSYPSREELVASGIPFINAGHLDGGEVDVSKTNYITTEKFSSMGGAKLVKGDILFCLRGSLGKIGLFGDNGTGALASSLVAVRANIDELDPRFFVYVLGSGNIRRKVEDVQTGSAQPNLSVEQLRAFRVNVPDYRTQIDIRSKIDDQTSDIDELISESEGLITLSEERRAALITAAVTGQIDVRTET